VVFHDVSFIEVKPHVTKARKGKPATVVVELTDFSVFYNQDSIAQAEAALGKTQKAGSRIVVEKGQIVKLTKDKKGVVTRETLTQHWTDWVDYWSVDFNFESKRKIIRVQNRGAVDRQLCIRERMAELSHQKRSLPRTEKHCQGMPSRTAQNRRESSRYLRQ